MISFDRIIGIFALCLLIIISIIISIMIFVG